MRVAPSPSRQRSTPRLLGLSTPGWVIAVVSLSIAAWLIALVVMGRMDEGPGTPLHALPAFLATWVLMLTAMMLPSELSYVGAYIAVLKSHRRGARNGSGVVRWFVGGYALAWLVYGLAAYVLDWILRVTLSANFAWNGIGPLLAGAALIVAGLYEISPLKRVCLTGCRTPLSFFARYWRDGKFGAASMGIRHGIVCVGCCWALMGVMFAVGIMSLTWMALLTVFMFAEKVLPNGQKLSVPIACFLWAMGAWIAVSPSTAPLMKNPMMFASFCRALT